MLFVFEILFLVVMGIVSIVTIVTVGRPLAIAYAEKMRAKNLDLDSEKVEMRIAALEEETRDLKRQLLSIQESSDFNDRLLEKGKG